MKKLGTTLGGRCESTFPDEVSHSAIREYLDLPSEFAVAQQLAAMTQSKLALNGSVEVEIAFQQMREVRQLLTEKRAEISRRMNLPTLHELTAILDPELGANQNVQISLKLGNLASDPVRMRIAELESFVEYNGEIDDPFLITNYREILADLADRPGDDRPALPCSLDLVLRYVALIPLTFSKDSLRKAFLNFLMVSPLIDPNQRRTLDELQRTTPALLESLSEQMASGTVADAAKTALEENYKAAKETSDMLHKINEFRVGFPNICDPPVSLRRTIEKSFEKYWSNVDPVDTEDRLAWLAKNFQPFWRKHRDYYLGVEAKTDKNRKDGRAKMSRATKGRDAVLWLERTRKFVEYLKPKFVEKSASRSVETLREHVADYKKFIETDKPQGFSKQYIIDNVAGFLSLICAYSNVKKNNSSAANSILQELRKSASQLAKETKADLRTAAFVEGKRVGGNRIVTKGKPIKNLSERTVIQCLNILRDFLGKPALSLPGIYSPSDLPDAKTTTGSKKLTKKKTKLSKSHTRERPRRMPRN